MHTEHAVRYDGWVLGAVQTQRGRTPAMRTLDVDEHVLHTAQNCDEKHALVPKVMFGGIGKVSDCRRFCGRKKNDGKNNGHRNRQST